MARFPAVHGETGVRREEATQAALEAGACEMLTFSEVETEVRRAITQRVPFEIESRTYAN